jgi:hypothetical protein
MGKETEVHVWFRFREILGKVTGVVYDSDSGEYWSICLEYSVGAVWFQYHRHCGFPHRLLLPKGKPEGMVYQLYVVVTDYDKDIVSCWGYVLGVKLCEYFVTISSKKIKCDLIAQ